MDDIRLARTFYAGLAGLGLLLAVTAWLSLVNLDALAAARGQGTEARRILTLYSDFDRLLLAAETGQRGYLLTGDETYLAPYREEVSKIDPVLDDLARSLRDRPQEAGLLDRLRTVTRQKLQEMDSTVVARRTASAEAALAIVHNDSGLHLMEQVRELGRQLQADLDADLVRRRAASDRNYTVARASAVVSAGLGFAVLIAFLLMVRRQLGLQRATVRALDAKREELRVTLASIGDGVITTDAQGHVNYLNTVAAQLCGWTSDSAAGRELEEVFRIVNEQTRATVENPARRAMREGIIVGLANHTLLITRDGHERPIDDSASPIRDAQGAIVGVVLIFRDVSLRKEHERAMHGAQQQVRMALEAGAIVGTWVWDVAADRLVVDEQLTTALGLARERAAQGIPMAEYRGAIAAEDLPLLDALTEEARLSGAPFRAEHRLQLSGKPVWVEASGRFERDAQGRALRFAVVLVEITERKRAEEQLLHLNETLERRVAERTRELEEQAEQRAEAEAQLRQAQKMEAVGQLTGGLAHDFNNIVGGISACLEMLESRAAHGEQPGPRQADYLTRARALTARAAALTHRLLAFSRRQPLAPQTVQIAELVQNMEALIRQTLGPSVELETRIERPLWNVRCDPNQLENTLLNLAINARDAMPDGGWLKIEVFNRPQTPETDATEDAVAIRVSDTGSGMTPDVAAHAFEPFYTTKAVGEGSGLGLSMIQGFVRQSGGDIAIDSAPGRGTAITFWLPRYAAEGQAAPIPVAASAPAPGGTYKILVVDDEEAIRQLVAEHLRDLGHECLEAANAQQALRLLESHRDFALLITDVGLPGGLNGRQLAEAAIAESPHLQVLLITGYSSHVIDPQTLGAGTQILSKPFSFIQLGRKIEAIFAASAADRSAAA